MLKDFIKQIYITYWVKLHYHFVEFMIYIRRNTHIKQMDINLDVWLLSRNLINTEIYSGEI